MRKPQRFLSYIYTIATRSFLVFFLVLGGCGQAYFPIQLNGISRSERTANQENTEVVIIPMTLETAKKANLEYYKRRVVKAGNLREPAKILPVSEAMQEFLPKQNDPGPYIMGIGDVISFTTFDKNNEDVTVLLTRDLVVKEDGYLYISPIGRIKAVGLSQLQLEDQIYQKFLEEDYGIDFELAITGFNSKNIIMISQKDGPTKIPYLSRPIYLDELLSSSNIKTVPGSDIRIKILRGDNKYVVSMLNLFEKSRKKIRLFPNDKIFIEPLNYRKEHVLIVGETGAQRSTQINSIERQTLSDTLFGSPVLNTVTSDFSQIYVLRKNKKIFNAYHLDITDPTRINFASKFEMRPDDVIFVATQPLSLYSRTLNQILGSTGLTLQARDTLKAELR
tara:strand:+ start:1504 stop:2679 length:1176 start_codon:yes stop_codon:yes gene_type:complete